MDALVPIETLDTSNSRIYWHIHPLLVPALYAANWSNIVADPRTGLYHSLFATIALQILFATLCLPPGSFAQEESPRSLRERKEKKGAKKAARNPLPYVFISAIVLAICALVAIPISFVLVLLGAAFTTDRWLTYLCAAHMALLTAYPTLYVHGFNNSKRLFEAVKMMRPLDEIHGGVVGTFVGAWLGAIPIPLDWDRPWQTYPITIITGAYIGYAAMYLLGGTLLRGKHISFVEQ